MQAMDKSSNLLATKAIKRGFLVQSFANRSGMHFYPSNQRLPGGHCPVSWPVCQKALEILEKYIGTSVWKHVCILRTE